MTAHVAAPTYMIGEKASDMIKATWKSSNSPGPQTGYPQGLPDNTMTVMVPQTGGQPVPIPVPQPVPVPEPVPEDNTISNTYENNQNIYGNQENIYGNQENNYGKPGINGIPINYGK